MFDSDWIKDMNVNVNENFSLKYKAGYSLTDEYFGKNKLVKYEFMTALFNELTIQLTFSSPLYVSKGGTLC